MRTGVIIAGGRSTRFDGADKAVAALAGTPMVRRVADRLAGVVDELVVNCREGQRDDIAAALTGYEHHVSVALDENPDRGPMAGIRTGLRAADSEYAAVVSCDMPFVDPGFIEYLLDRAKGHDAAVPRPDEWFQTTQAVYRAAPMADACDDALARGESKIIEPLFELDYVVIGVEEIRAHASHDTFENLNTREEFDAAARRLH